MRRRRASRPALPGPGQRRAPEPPALRWMSPPERQAQAECDDQRGRHEGGTQRHPADDVRDQGGAAHQAPRARDPKHGTPAPRLKLHQGTQIVGSCWAPGIPCMKSRRI